MSSRHGHGDAGRAGDAVAAGSVSDTGAPTAAGSPRVAVVGAAAVPGSRILEVLCSAVAARGDGPLPVSYTHLRAPETVLDLVCRLLLDNTQRRQPPG